MAGDWTLLPRAVVDAINAMSEDEFAERMEKLALELGGEEAAWTALVNSISYYQLADPPTRAEQARTAEPWYRDF